MTMILSSLSRTTVRRLAAASRIVTPTTLCRAVASSSVPHLAGHPGPTSSSSGSRNTNGKDPSEEARQAAEYMRKLQEDPTRLNEIHDDQPMYFKPEGPDSLPGDREYRRSQTSRTSQQRSKKES